MLQTLKGHFQNLSRWRFSLEMTWQAVSSLRDFDTILSHSYKPILEWEALGKSFKAGTQRLQQEAGVCTSEANNNMIYLVSKMEAKLLILYTGDNGRSWMRGKKSSFGTLENVNLLTVWNILSSRQVHSEPGAALNIVFEFMCFFSVTGCEAAVLAMWRESKELLISN